MGHAVASAMRGDWSASFHYHPLGIPVLIAWTGWLVWTALRACGADRAPVVASR
ncbi:MAG: DUF2752 domain-containing protein [Elusimicrobia bacterium]|nr:DUF2752 domain-containing protein [Elusimicrobiota bacterium]